MEKHIKLVNELNVMLSKLNTAVLHYRNREITGKLLKSIIEEKLNEAIKTLGGKMTKLDQWEEFTEMVNDHINNYVIPQYGDYPDEMVENWDIKSIKEQLDLYVKRIGTSIRGTSEAKRDALKIAHYACYLYEKI